MTLVVALLNISEGKKVTSSKWKGDGTYIFCGHFKEILYFCGLTNKVSHVEAHTLGLWIRQNDLDWEIMK